MRQDLKAAGSRLVPQRAWSVGWSFLSLECSSLRGSASMESSGFSAF